MDFNGHISAKADKIHGLSEKEAKKLLNKYGPNAFKGGKKINPLGIFVSQFKDILIVILVVSTLLSVFMGEITEAIAIILIIMLNSIMGFVQEYRTEKTLDALKNMAAPTARALRDGLIVTMPAAEIVPGDVIIIDQGDRIPADARLLEAKSLQIDESLLTGESMPVEKAIGTVEKIFMGTMVTKGRGMALISATGMQTEMGKIAGMLTTIEDEQTPLQKRLAELGKYIAIGCLVTCSLVSVTGILRGEPVFNMIIIGISLAVAAVPEGLPAIVTIALALGVGRMLKRNALIRKLTAVETLGCATVVCSDKTGTLTENKMTVRSIYTPEHTCEVTGSGFNTEGEFLFQGRRVNVNLMEDVRLALEIGACCNNAELISRPAVLGLFKKIEHSGFEISGDPTEAALLVAAQKAGITQREIDKSYKKLDELPFDSERKCMSVIVSIGGGKRRLFVKGAPDIIIEKCSSVHNSKGDHSMTESVKAAIMRANDSMADRALRVLAVAYRDLNESSGITPKELEKGLAFSGLEGMLDPPRREAFSAVRKCIQAGIRPVMITGDHKKTAAAVARELGILTDDKKVITGAELDNMSEAQLLNVVSKTAVFARVSPNHKLRIVRSLKKCGNVVAMTGDGVNDAPAVKEADIGVSMGLTGTDVTKEASSIILLDDNFASMIAAIEEGRVIYRNIRKFIRYLISCNIGEVLTMFAGMLMGMPVVLLPIQILWVNLVTDGLPAIALGLEPPDDDVMDQKPRGVTDSVFSDGLLGMMLFRGCIIGISTLGSFISIYKMTGSVESARTAAFMTLVFVQLVHVFECKSEKKNLFHINLFNNLFLVGAVLVSITMILSAVYLPILQTVFGTVALTPPQLLHILGYVLIGPILSTVIFHDRSGKKIRSKNKTLQA